MAKVFISYRRKDSAPVAERIYQWLTEWLSANLNVVSVFMDRGGIEPGENFHAALRREIDSAEIMLVVIGKNWALAEDDDGMIRLEEPRDIVRREVAIGLESNMRVVPVLVSGAEMPQAARLPSALAKLTALHAFQVNEDRFGQDMSQLAEYLRKWTGEHVRTEDDNTEHVSPEYEESRLHMIQKKVCMLGAFGVGKTSLVKRYVQSMFDEKYLTTIGVKIDKKVVKLGDTEINMVLWDIAGEEKGFPVKLHYLKGASGVVLVADGRKYSLGIALDMRERVRNEAGPIPCVLAANKIDLCRE